MARPRLPKNVEELVHWYERYISPLSLIGGFLADNYILLRRVDLWTSNALLGSYLLTAALGIILINLIETGRLRTPWVLKVAPAVPIIVQFSFGGLFSGFLSLYSRSAAFALSWVFVLIIAALLVGNERFLRLYRRFTFQIGLYFTVLFSFSIFFLPVMFRTIGPSMFVVSGLVSVACIALFMRLIKLFMPEIVRRDRTRIARIVAIIYLTFNALYFSNAIPPLPLALKEAGVYHSVQRIGSTYVLTAEPLAWWNILERYNTTFHQAPGENAVVWSAVFAPSGLSTVILHEWQRYDDAARTWETTNTEKFPITGGRDGGYRGYSIKGALKPGRWRVNVVTEYGQVIGRVSFTVVATSSPVYTEQVER